jgi:hypothetical protein
MGGETLEELERHIEETRNHLDANLSELHGKLDDAVDWRVQFRKHPLPIMGVGFGLGFILSKMLLGKARSELRFGADGSPSAR